MTSAETNREMVRLAYEAMAGGDAKGFLAVLDPEIEIHEPPFLPYGGTHRGVPGVIEFFQQAAGVVAPGRLAVEGLTADGDTVVATLTIGLRNGADAQVCEIWRIRDGKAVEIRVFWFDPAVLSVEAAIQ